MDALPEGPERRQALVTFLTTEHFTLQGARAAAVAESNSRLQIYMGFLSMSVLTLALAAQVSSLGDPFFAFAFILLPVAYLFGLATIGRLNQSWTEWFIAGQGMSRIRRFFVDMAPEARPYLSLPATDDPWETLSGFGIQVGGRLRGFTTAFAVIALGNSVIAGAFAGLLVLRLSHRGLVATAVGTVMLVLSATLTMASGRRWFMRNMASVEVRFPPADGPVSA